MMARSVFHDLFPAEEAAELEMRAKLLSGINKWLSKSSLTQVEAAKRLGITQARGVGDQERKDQPVQSEHAGSACGARRAAPRHQIPEGGMRRAHTRARFCPRAE